MLNKRKEILNEHDTDDKLHQKIKCYLDDVVEYIEIINDIQVYKKLKKV